MKRQVTEVYGVTPPRVAFPPVTTPAIVERLAKDLEDVALELGKLVEKQHAVMTQCRRAKVFGSVLTLPPYEIALLAALP